MKYVIDLLPEISLTPAISVPVYEITDSDHVMIIPKGDGISSVTLFLSHQSHAVINQIQEIFPSQWVFYGATLRR